MKRYVRREVTCIESVGDVFVTSARAQVYHASRDNPGICQHCNEGNNIVRCGKSLQMDEHIAENHKTAKFKEIYGFYQLSPSTKTNRSPARETH